MATITTKTCNFNTKPHFGLCYVQEHPLKMYLFPGLNIDPCLFLVTLYCKRSDAWVKLRDTIRQLASLLLTRSPLPPPEVTIMFLLSRTQSSRGSFLLRIIHQLPSQHQYQMPLVFRTRHPFQYPSSRFEDLEQTDIVVLAYNWGVVLHIKTTSY